jgi:hypothetical protein
MAGWRGEKGHKSIRDKRLRHKGIRDKLLSGERWAVSRRRKYEILISKSPG